jgi:hypothetical protein
MTVALVIAFVVLAVAAFTIYRSRRMLPEKTTAHLPPPTHFEGLFLKTALEEAGDPVNRDDLDRREREAIIERAARGDIAVLSEAHDRGDAALYKEALDRLMDFSSGCQGSFEALVSAIAKSKKLRANTRLAERLIEALNLSPDRRSAAEALHVAALSDDAATYEKAIEATLRLWREGRLAELLSEELRDLFESQYWVLADRARSSGAGFLLKQRLAEVRRELAATTPAR